MRTFPSCPPWIRRIFALLALGASLGSSQAHDPGLSTLKLTLLTNRVEALLTLARADVEAIVPLDGNEDGTITPAEWAAAQLSLQKLGLEALELNFDEAPPLLPQIAPVAMDEANNILFHLVYAGRGSSYLAVRCRLLSQMAFSHRQFLSLQDLRGTLLEEKMLSLKDPVFSWTLQENRAMTAVTPPDRGETLVQFLVLGIKHILTGYDHLLFLFGLLVVCEGWKTMAKIITCFTLAHSLTLCLAALNLVHFSSTLVEPMIAASIMYVGAENLLLHRTPPWRWTLTFAFGLIHGFGFAEVLREMGLGTLPGGVALPLLCFNLGVELGQLLVALPLLPLLWHLRRKPQFVRRWVPACSLLVLVAGAYWLVERTWPH